MEQLKRWLANPFARGLLCGGALTAACFISWRLLLAAAALLLLRWLWPKKP